jgi:hypothetical protein
MTMVDERVPKFPDGPHLARRGGEIPSVVRPPRGTPDPAPRAPSAAPPNVIPFTKPRAIAAIAAANPNAVVRMAPAPASSPAGGTLDSPGGGASHPRTVDRGAHRAKQPTPAPVSAAARSMQPVPQTVIMMSPPANSAPSMPMPAAAAPAPVSAWSASPNVSSVPAAALATGWTPPQAVKVVAQPARDRSAPVAQMAAQAPAQFAHSHAPVSPSLPTAYPPTLVPPAPASPAPVTPAITTRPASQMPAAEPQPSMFSAPAPAPAPAPAKWAVYERLGLGMPKLDHQKASKLIVNAYRLLGFAILTIIVIVLVGYIASSVFYYFSNSWIVPMAVTPTDEKVVSLQAQLAEQQNARDRIADDLQQAERAILAQQRFQAEFAKAIRSDLEGRKLALGRIQALATAAAQTRAAIKSQNSAYASASQRRMAQEYAAGLIDRNAMLSGKYQLAQITSSNLTLAERQAEFETRAAELEAQTRSLDAILTNAGSSGSPALSYEVLRIKQEYEASRLDLAKAGEQRDTLKAALARQDKIVAALKQSAYLRAVADKASVAFVPYSNLSNVQKGTSLYACKLGMIFCYHVGEVLEVLPGEVQGKHPHRDKNLRGQLIELKLDADDPGAAADDVLFAGGRPILF